MSRNCKLLTLTCVYLLLVLLLLITCSSTKAINPPGSFKYSTTATILAGGLAMNATNRYGDDGLATLACIDTIETVKLGSNNSIYIVDSALDVIRRISLSDGKISLFAGSYATPGSTGNGGLATLAKLNDPKDVVEYDGYLYIAESANHCIRRVNLMTNIIENVVGVCGTAGFSGDNSNDVVKFNGTMGLAISETGRYMYISDTYNCRVRLYDMIYKNITTLFGDGELNTVGAAKSSIANPQGMVIVGNFLYVTESYVGKFSKIDLETKQADTLLSDLYNYPTKVVRYGDNLYISSINNPVVRVYDYVKNVDSGYLDTPGINSTFAYMIDSYGNQIVSDRIGYVYNVTTKSIIAGGCATKYFVRNMEPTQGNMTFLRSTNHIIVDKQSAELKYAAQLYIPFIQKYSKGISTIIAGNGRVDSLSVFYQKEQETLAINAPIGISINAFAENSQGSLYFSNTSTVMKIDSITGVLSVVVGGYQVHNDIQYGGLASNSSLKTITSLLINDTNVLVATSDPLSIFTIDQKGILNVLVGNSTLFGKRVFNMALDPLDNNIVFYDSISCSFYKILPNKSIVTLLGNSICKFSNETDLTTSTYTTMSGQIRFFSNGDMAIQERGNHCIRRWIRSTNVITTILGTPGTIGILNSPISFSINTDNSIIVSDAYDTIRKYVTSGCAIGWYGSDCLTPVFDVKFYSSLTYTNTSVKVVVNIQESVKSIYQSGSYLLTCKRNQENYKVTALTIQSFSNPLSIYLDSNLFVKGNYSCSLTTTVGSESFKTDFSNTLQVLEYENVVSESFLKTIPVSDVATIASNKDTYSKSTNVVQVLTVMTDTLTSSQRNTSNSDETLKISEALTVITSQAQVTSTILTSISNLVVNISKELSQLNSNTLQFSGASYESTLSNVLIAYSNCYSSNSFNISSSSNSIIEEMVIVATKTSTQVDSLFQVVTTSFIVSVARNINQSTVSDGNTTIVTPTELSDLEDISVGSITYLNVEKLTSILSGSILTNNYSLSNLITLTGKSFVNLAKVTDLKYVSNGKILNVSNLSEPISIKFNVENRTLDSIKSNSSLTVSCKYFDESARIWKTDGCTTLIDQTNGLIDCQCTHTTTFSAFLQFNKSSSRPLTIGKLIVSSLLILLSFAAIGGLILTCRRNPTKSRWYLPYFALSSLIIELLFSVIIPGGMFLDSDGDGTILQAVFTMISCMFYCLALLNYLMFNLRYITFKYIYELMAILNEKNETQTDKVLKWTKFILTNNVFSIVLNAIIALFIIGYFVIFISLMGTNTIDNTTYTKIMTSSVFAFVMTISLLVCAIYLVDIYMELRYVQLNSKLKDNDKKILNNPLKNYFIVNDNLSFRKEFAFFFISIAFYVISNAMGFTYLTSSSTSKDSYLIVGYIFEAIYNLLLILSFGGVVSIISIYEYLISKKKNYSQLNDNEDVEEESRIKDILTHPTLCQVFEQFAKGEYSLENVILWKKLYPLLENINKGDYPTPENLEKEFNEWNNNFITSNSPMEINISYHIKKSFLTQFENVKSGKIDRDCLKETLKDLYCAVMVNLNDTFSRFYITSSYSQMNKLFELKEQMGSAIKTTTTTQ